MLLVTNLSLGDKQVDWRPEHLYAVADPQFVRTMSVMLGPPLTGGNQVESLLNGDQIFPAMLDAIRSAKETVTFETYIYWSGSIGKAFADVLAERAQAGVRVHVLIDWVGSSKLEAALLEEMQAAGVELRRYNKPRWYTIGRLNNRTHRKLLVVDGRVGFTGGVGIADKWLGNAQSPENWRDTHFRIEGPAVAHFQAAFLDNWTKATGEVLHGTPYFPPLVPDRARTGADVHQLPGRGC